ncbi:MAG: acetoin dehydrogenase dihydrolipoyllysine-residue acetyltransferase subunit [Gemmobacter sp.]|nr:acetoin dehydrogenase dihydrolipoyllysine-residue acetyltransferase subunit [Gemmobacter sp.]
MPVEVILPKVDMDMSHGTLATWHVAEGDLVKQGAALFDIETDKAAMEVEAPASGHLHHILAKPGDRVPVGAVIAWLYAEGEAVGAPPGLPAPASLTAAAGPVATQPDAARPEPVVASRSADMPTTGLRATPAARKSAREAGIALVEVPGTGPLGRIQRADVAGFLRNSTAEAASLPGGWTPEPGPLHVSRRGGDGIPLLLIHGFTADSQSWAPLEKALGPRRPLIRMDLPGHGKSPKRRIGSFAELARMMVEAFDDATRDVAQVHVIGHSLGGALALALADIRARRVASLSLLAPAGLGPEIDAAALQGITRATRPESLAPWLRRLTATPDAISDDYARAAMAARRDPALRAAQGDMAQALFADGVQTFDLRAALARLDLPAQILWGRQDHILPQRHALAADGEFAIHLLAGAGHVPQIECPDRVARIIMRQVSAVEAPA